MQAVNSRAAVTCVDQSDRMIAESRAQLLVALLYRFFRLTTNVTASKFNTPLAATIPAAMAHDRCNCRCSADSFLAALAQKQEQSFE